LAPALPTAATGAGIDVLKPKVLAAMNLLNEEAWSMEDPGTDVVVGWIERLKEAEGRTAAVATKSECPPDPKPVPPGRGAGGKRKGPIMGRVIGFSSGQLERVDAALLRIRALDGWNKDDFSDAELYVQALELFAENWEAA
jgi:hypothetical protein